MTAKKCTKNSRPTLLRKLKKQIGWINKTSTVCTCVTLFCTFLCRHYTTTTWRYLISRFMEDVNNRLHLIKTVAVWIIAMKIKENAISYHSFSYIFAVLGTQGPLYLSPESMTLSLTETDFRHEFNNTRQFEFTAPGSYAIILGVEHD